MVLFTGLCYWFLNHAPHNCFLLFQSINQSRDRDFLHELCKNYRILVHIFKYLSVTDLLRAAQVCLLWRDLAFHPSLVSLDGSVFLSHIHVSWCQYQNNISKTFIDIDLENKPRVTHPLKWAPCWTVQYLIDISGSYFCFYILPLELCEPFRLLTLAPSCKS